MRLHTGSKPFKCPHCDHQFRTSGHRKSHIQQHFKPIQRKRRARWSSRTAPDPTTELLNTTALQAVQQQQQPQQLILSTDQLGGTQVVNLESLAGQPVSLSITDAFGQLTDQTGQVLEGLQLQLPSQGIQLSDTIQIDPALLQQLQQQGNVSVTIDPSSLLQAANPNLIQPAGLVVGKQDEDVLGDDEDDSFMTDSMKFDRNHICQVGSLIHRGV